MLIDLKVPRNLSLTPGTRSTNRISIRENTLRCFFVIALQKYKHKRDKGILIQPPRVKDQKEAIRPKIRAI
jgi:hypothetical protein